MKPLEPECIGEIEQVPPMYSALKRDGRPLHEYARQGITLERQAREVTIDSLDLQRIDLLESPVELSSLAKSLNLMAGLPETSGLALV